jgi:AcrR family transcriptional regulator
MSGVSAEPAPAPTLSAPVPKQVRSELSTARLLDAAADLIAEVGYDRATLAAIGERAGYSHGLVTRRFGSKEGLLWAVIERMTVGWSEATLRPSIGERVGADALIAIVQSIRKSIAKSPREMVALYSLMFEALRPIPILHERVAEIHDGLTKDVARYVRRGIKAGVVRSSVQPDAIARLFVSTLRGCAYQWLLNSEDFPVDATLRSLGEAVEVLLRPDA